MCKFIAERIITCQCTNENLGNSLTKRDFRLQSGNLVYKMRFSFTKRDSWVTNGTLALHFTHSKVLTVYNDKSIIQNDKKSCHFDNESCQKNNKFSYAEAFIWRYNVKLTFHT